MSLAKYALPSITTRGGSKWRLEVVVLCSSLLSTYCCQVPKAGSGAHVQSGDFRCSPVLVVEHVPKGRWGQRFKAETQDAALCICRYLFCLFLVLRSRLGRRFSIIGLSWTRFTLMIDDVLWVRIGLSVSSFSVFRRHRVHISFLDQVHADNW